ncbi:MAG: tetratricopeptide repeat protein [Bdellovibrio sp.]|nr:tetratricopeptide repeat protein [Bdellovibrio sp.]
MLIRIVTQSVVFGYFLFVLGCSTTEVVNEHRNYTNTEKARMVVEIANGALAEGDPVGALQHLVRAEAFDNEIPELYHSKALAFFMRQDLDNALRAARRAVELKPNYSDANNTLGKLLMDAGQYPEAELKLQLAANDVLYRDAYKAQTNLGILHYKNGRNEVAQKYFDRAIAGSPNTACVAYYFRGNIELKNSELKKAIESYTLATQKTCAQFVDAQFALGLAYSKSGQIPLAKQTFLEIQKRYPKHALAEKALEQLRFLP